MPNERESESEEAQRADQIRAARPRGADGAPPGRPALYSDPSPDDLECEDASEVGQPTPPVDPSPDDFPEG